MGHQRRHILIEIRLDGLLGERGRTYYWLAEGEGISHTTLRRLKKGKAMGVNFVTPESICRVMNCQPGDVIRLAGAGKTCKKKGAGARSPARRHNTK
jgi:putative transcriptional regulator